MREYETIPRISGGPAAVLTGITGPTYTDNSNNAGLVGSTGYTYTAVGSNAYTTTRSITLGSITTLVAITAFGTPVATSTVGGTVNLSWTGGTSSSTVTYTYTVYRNSAVLNSSNYTVTGTASPVSFSFTDTASYPYYFVVTATVGANTTNSPQSNTVTSASPITSFGTVTATASATAGQVSIAWTGGTGSGVTYAYAVYKNASATPMSTSAYTTSSTTSSPVTFTFTDTASYSYTFAVTANGSGGSTLTSATSAAVNSAAPGMTSFTTMSNITTTSPVAIFNTNSVAGGLNTGSGSVAVSRDQSRLLLGTLAGLYYSTSSDGGTTWATPILAKSNSAGYGTVSMTSDGTKGVFMNGRNPWSFSWPSGSPGSSITTTQLDTNNNDFWFTSITPDGQYALFQAAGGFVRYAYWNGSSYTFSSTLIGAVAPHCGVAISPDYSLLAYELNGSWYSVNLTWSNNVPTVGTSSSLNANLDSRGFGWIGGGQTGKPSYLIVQPASGKPPHISTYNSTTNTLSTPVACNNLANGYTSMVNSGDGNFAFCPCGSQGNVLYYVGSGGSGNTVNVQKVTWQTP